MRINGRQLDQLQEGVLSAAINIDLFDSYGMQIKDEKLLGYNLLHEWVDIVNAVSSAVAAATALLTFAFLLREKKPVEPPNTLDILREMIPTLNGPASVPTLSWLPADSNTKEIRAGHILGPAGVMARRKEASTKIIYPYGTEFAEIDASPEEVFTFKTLGAIRSLQAAIGGAYEQSLRPSEAPTPSFSVLSSRVLGSHIIAGHPGSNRMSGLVRGYKRTGDQHREEERQFVGVTGLDCPVRFILDSKEDSCVGRNVYLGKNAINNWGLIVNGRTVMAKRGYAGALHNDFLVISLLPNYLHKESFKLGDTILLIEGAHGVGTEASSMLWKDEKLVSTLYKAWQRERKPRYWQAVFEARNITMKRNPKFKLEPSANNLDFQGLYKVITDEQQLVDYGEGIQDRFAARMAELQPL